MGTRGAYGFHKGGVDKITYNHWDSYPDGLGDEIAKFIKKTTIKQMNEIFEKIILVDEHNSKPTKEQIKIYKEFADISVSCQSYEDWYCLLYKTKQDLSVYKEEGIVHMMDGGDFVKDSLFCEWAYIINLDTNVLEVCGGFLKKPKNQHPRYKQTKKEAMQRRGDSLKDKPYYSVALLYTYPLAYIRKGRDPFFVQKLFKSMYKDD